MADIYDSCGICKAIYHEWRDMEKCSYCCTFFKCLRLYMIGGRECLNYCGYSSCVLCNPDLQDTFCITHRPGTLLFCDMKCKTAFNVAHGLEPSSALNSIVTE